MFDPYGDWIPEQLRGYCLSDEGLYQPIKNSCSEVLQLRLQQQDYLLSFYRLDNNQKLLTPDELLLASQEATRQAEEANRQAEEANRQAEESEQRARLEKARADRLAEKLRQLGVESADLEDL